MSFHSWHIYGYGVMLSEITNISVPAVIDLAQLAPQFATDFNAWRSECGLNDLTLEDFADFDQESCLGLATVLKEIIEEREGIVLTACSDFDGNQYLLYTPEYPWQMSELEKKLREGDIQSLFVKYLSKITDETIVVDYYGPENGG